ncbi:MAG: two-component regulator propeller domain-containing protein [Bacteroidota bacterium]
MEKSRKERFRYFSLIAWRSARNIYLAFAICLFASLDAQRAELEFFTVNEGLSSPVVTDIVQDEQGYLWMGTLDGLNRFDGYAFRTFNQGPYSETQLSRGNISHLSIDQEGKLIISYEAAAGWFDRFDPNTFQVEQVQLLNRDEVEGHPRTIANDRFGRTFIAYNAPTGIQVYEYTPDSLLLVVDAAGTFERVAPSVDLLVLDNSQYILYDDKYGLRHYSAAGRLLFQDTPTEIAGIEPSVYSDSYEKKFQRLSFLKEGGDGQVYLSFFNRPGLFHYDAKARAPIAAFEQTSESKYFKQAWRDDKKCLLFSVQNDNPLGDFVDQYLLLERNGQVEDYEELIRASKRIGSAFSLDFRSTIYLGTAGGLVVYNPASEGIRTYLAQEQEEEQFANLIRGIAEHSNGDVYFLTEDNGLFRIQGDTRKLDSVTVLDLNGEKIPILRSRGLLFGPDGLLYFTSSLPTGQIGGLFIQYDPVSCVAKTIKTELPLESICLGADQTIWLGTARSRGQSKLLKYEPGSQSLIEQKNAQGESFLPNADIVHLSQSQDQEKLYIGTDGAGLLIYHIDNRTYDHVAPPLPGQSAAGAKLNDYRIFYVHEIENRDLMVATQGGLHVYNPASKKVLAHYSRVEGLSSNVICGIIPADDGNYWLSTYYGLTYFRPEGDPPFLRYYRSDGLSNNEFNRFAHYRDADGRNYFGGVNGLNVFYDEELLGNKSESQVLIAEINCYGSNGTRTIDTGLKELPFLNVARDEKSIAVQFAMPATPTANRNRFRVRLEGEENDWVELGSDRTARYSNLSGGRYTLIVQGADANGNYVGNDLILPIIVKQYVWEKSWFLILLGLIAAFSLAAVFYFKLREKLRAEKLRTQLSSDIHDEVSGLLAGITMQSELLQGHTEDGHLNHRLKGIGEAGRKAMSKLSDVIWSIDSRRDTVGELFQRMQEHADDVLMPLDIKYKFYLDDSFDHQKTISGDRRQDLYYIYKEAINNIARHSNGDYVKIIMTQQGKNYELLIEDNGTPQATNGLNDRRSFRTGQGLNNLQMRAKRLGAALEIGMEEGYRIRLRGRM